MSVASLVQVGLLAFRLHRRTGSLDLARTLSSVAKVSAAAAGAALVALAFQHYVEHGAGGTLTTLVAVALFGLSYLGLARTLRCPELSAMTAPLARRFRGLRHPR
jgi:hypothetical protein